MIHNSIPIRTLLFALFVFAVATQPANAQKQERPGIKAPQWQISEWINSPGTNVDQLRGKVIVVDFFQLWCPGCNKFTIPLMAQYQKTFAKEIEAGRLVFVSIHTVFEGHNYQNLKRLKSYLKRKRITHPVGNDRHVKGDRVPQTMRSYQTRGTPEIAMIDKEGYIRFQKFGYFEPEFGEKVIRALLGEPRAS
ncbi:MAG: TlpA family protein disulfide reductase [Methyloligellaceae bacterium]